MFSRPVLYRLPLSLAPLASSRFEGVFVMKSATRKCRTGFVFTVLTPRGLSSQVMIRALSDAMGRSLGQSMAVGTILWTHVAGVQLVPRRWIMKDVEVSFHSWLTTAYRAPREMQWPGNMAFLSCHLISSESEASCLSPFSEPR